MKNFCFLFLFLFCIMVNYSFEYIFKIINALSLFIILILLKNTLKYIYSLFIVLLSVLWPLYFSIGPILDLLLTIQFYLFFLQIT